jgi:hypothetical protein
MENKKLIRFFYQVATNIFYINDGDDNELKQETVKTKEIKQYNYFEAFNTYDCSLDGLKKYRDDFNTWSLELKDIDNAMSINYKKYYNHESAVLCIFGMRSTKYLKSMNMENITFNEFCIYEMCNNGALMTLSSVYNDKTVKSFGYDYSSYYPTLLSSNFHTSQYKKVGQSFMDDDFKIPIKQGKLSTIRLKFHKVDFDYSKLKYGIYKCVIKCENQDFKKVFAFNKNNCYTHYDIKFACKYRTEYGINIRLELGEDNALIYEEEDLIYSHDIFKDWYYDLSKLKKAYPKNKLLKHVFSSLWGSLIRFEREFIEGDEIYNIDASDIDSKENTAYKIINEKYYKCDNNDLECKTLYECIKSDKPYSNNLARLKPFFTSFSRVNIGELCIKENILNNVIRVHTDNITLNKPYDFTTHLKYYPLPEDKTTGTFLWKNVNKYPSYNEKTNTYTWKNEPYINK